MNSNIKIAYIVLCHKNAGQINKMIKKLDSKNCDFFLHIDKKSSIEEDIIKNNHIFVLPNDKRIKRRKLRSRNKKRLCSLFYKVLKA